ncbi:hypothetical protein UlMin_002608 [Ulmus minor]
MVSAETARTVVGIIGNVFALFFFLSPVPTFVEIWKRGSVEEYSVAPYLAGLVNCLVWTVYGLPVVQPGSILVLTISVAGVAIESAYVVLFFTFSSDKKKRLKMVLVVVLEIVFTALLASLSITFVDTHKRRSMIVGVVCIFFSAIMYSSPLAVMKLVIKTKSVEYMPFTLSLASLINGFVWTCYALIRFDPIVIVPNGLGSLFGLAQLILHAIYYKSTKQQMEAKKTKQVTLSEVYVVTEEEPKKTPKTYSNAPQNGLASET